MKNFLIISLLFLSLGFSQKEYNFNDLIKMDNGLYTEKFSDEPISGKVYGYFGEKGNLKKVYMGKLLNGKKDGLFTTWYENGKKNYEATYKKGELNGLYTEWDKNSNKIKEGSYVNKLMEGEWYFYYFNMNSKRWMSMTGSFKSGDGGNPNENSGVPTNGRHGLFKSFYENGQKLNEFYYKDGKIDGLNTYWYENGQKEQELTFKAGKAEGLRTDWYENGNKRLEGTYKDGKLDGLWSQWWENGVKMSEVTFKKGKDDGLHTKWHENGQKMSEQTYKNKKQDGLGTIWYENGQKSSEVTYKDGKKDGLALLWQSNGNKQYEAAFKDGKEDGLFTLWYYEDSFFKRFSPNTQNGQKSSEGTFKDRKLDGLYTEWYINGQKSSEITYKDGKIDGLYTDWYENGQKQYEVAYKDDTIDGLYTDWYENGQKRAEVTFKDGRQEGIYTEWYMNGQKSSEATFKNGNFDGLFTDWYENGNKKLVATFKNGKGVGIHTTWYENGQKSSEGTFKDGKLDGLATDWYLVGSHEKAPYGKEHYEEVFKDPKLDEVYTQIASSITDIDGNSYKTIKIGNQVWMAENLKVTKYSDGTSIPTGHSHSDWASLSTGAYAIYNPHETSRKTLSYFRTLEDTYGYLYNWFAVKDNRNICPENWHVPTEKDWATLIMNSVGSFGFGGAITLKETGRAHWEKESPYGVKFNPIKPATNESGFTALPGGLRSELGYSSMGLNGYFWSSTREGFDRKYRNPDSPEVVKKAWVRMLSNNYYWVATIFKDEQDKTNGCSVRCLKD